MKSYYKVKYKRTSHSFQKPNSKWTKIETRELLAESPEKINTYRLAGFQGDSIEILEVKKIRDQEPVEVDADVERNELMFSVSLDHHLESTLEHDEEFEQQVLELAEEMDIEPDEALEEMGYHEQVHDNSYNYSSDFDNDMDFKVYTLEPKSSDWIYDDSAIVFVREHQGLDARAGYVFKGIYKRSDFEGLAYFLDFHVRLTVQTMDGEDVEDFEGDGAAYQLLREYKLKSFNPKTQEIVVTKDGEDFLVNYYHPAFGV